MTGNRREFVQQLVAASLIPLTGRLPMTNTNWRSHFPALDQRVNGERLAYLDTAATAHRPREVTQAIVDFYGRDNANPGRTLHTLARRADADYETARLTVAQFINA